ncbi:MAG: AbrB/MazE/SpoVT family DNA-binding domain-containing protein [Thaumarchaeota archaeon]|nr:AbrB/MazE/SpoVT family DNA-binding domain-containing protein [Nitrososphaerota archaeon]
MKEPSYVRVNRKGRVAIPSSIREKLRIEEGAILEIQAQDGGDIVLRRTLLLKGGGRVVGNKTHSKILGELDQLRRT